MKINFAKIASYIKIFNKNPETYKIIAASLARHNKAAFLGLLDGS